MFERNDLISEEEWIIQMAERAAKMSHDPNTQVGAIIVDKNNKIISIGYNSEPNGFNPVLFPWSREGTPLEIKYLYVCHAELNAICNFHGSKKDLEGAKIYVTLFPCNKCAKLIVQSGIKEVIYSCDKYANTDSTIASKRIFDQCNIKYRQLELEKEKNKILIKR